MTEPPASREQRGTMWLLAKYVPDLRRNEPRNVGLILLRGDEVAARFVGQRQSDGTIDGRKAKMVNLANYKRWVAYWRRLMDKGPDALLAATQRPERTSSYVLEVGGEFLSDEDPAMPTSVLLDHLYHELVDDKLDMDEPVSLWPMKFEDAVRTMLQSDPRRTPRKDESE